MPIRPDCLLLTAALAAAGCASPAVRTAPTTCMFGKDQIVIRDPLPPPSQEEQARLTRGCADLRDENAVKGLPVRQGVKVFSAGFYGVVAREGGRCTRVTWENVGRFAEIRAPEQWNSILELFHSHLPKLMISASSFGALLKELRPGSQLPFKVLKADVDLTTVSSSCSREGPYFRWHFIYVEAASVVEYKYVMDTDNRIGRLRRVLIAGPENPVGNGDAGPDTWSQDKKQRYEAYSKCREFLEAFVERSRGEAPKEK